MQTPRITIGWEEWVSLPALGLPAIKAKVDTGARTSALHAYRIEPGEAPGTLRIAIHPVPGRDDVTVLAEADVIDMREVTSSNGDKEIRPVIITMLQLGEASWPIEVTLTNREGMAYRMLLGRQALQAGVLVDPAASFLLPKLTHRMYRKKKK